jgi:signal transduction histidine kinase
VVRDLTKTEVSDLLHDLRGSTAALSGFVQALREEAADKLDAESLSYLERIERNVRKIESRLDVVRALAE